MNSDRANREISTAVNDLCDRESVITKWSNLIEAGLFVNAKLLNRFRCSVLLSAPQFLHTWMVPVVGDDQLATSGLGRRHWGAILG